MLNSSFSSFSNDVRSHRAVLLSCVDYGIDYERRELGMTLHRQDLDILRVYFFGGTPQLIEAN